MSANHNTKSASIDVLVVGDVFKETLILPLSHPKSNTYAHLECNDSDADQIYWRVENRSGSLLLADVIARACGYNHKKMELGDNSLRVYNFFGLQDDPKREKLDIGDFKELITALGLFPKVHKAKDQTMVYRMAKRIGHVSRFAHNAREEMNKRAKRALEDLIGPLTKILEADHKHDTRRTRILVIYDRNDAFRDSDDVTAFLNSQIESWRESVLIVLVMRSPLAEGKIWEWILDSKLQRQCIVIISENSVRRGGGILPATASMEEGLEAFLESKNTNKVLKDVSQCRHLIIRFNDANILHWDHNQDTNTVLTYHGFPFAKRGPEPPSDEIGRMAGYTVILTASIVKAIRSALSEGKIFSDQIDDGIRLGALLIKEHFREGFAEHAFHEKQIDKNHLNSLPFRKLFERYNENHGKARELYLEDKQREFQVTSVTVPVTSERIERNWSRVTRFLRISDFTPEQKIYHVVLQGLHQVVKSNPPTSDRPDWYPPSMLQLPYAPYGAIYATDRDEISAFESVASIMRKYLVMRLLNNSDSFIFAKGCLPGSLDLSQDLLSFSPPDVPLGFEVMPGEVLHDGIDQLAHAAEAAGQDRLLAQVSEEAFDQIHPG
jgi:hypothetical protein